MPNCRTQGNISYSACTIHQPEISQLCICLLTIVNWNIHLQGTRGTQVGLQDILKTLTGADVDLQGLRSPLRTVSLCWTTEGLMFRGGKGKKDNCMHTLDSALGLSNCVADIFCSTKERQATKNPTKEIRRKTIRLAGAVGPLRRCPRGHKPGGVCRRMR